MTSVTTAFVAYIGSFKFAVIFIKLSFGLQMASFFIDTFSELCMHVLYSPCLKKNESVCLPKRGKVKSRKTFYFMTRANGRRHVVVPSR